MSFLMASDALAHLERNGDIVLTGRGEFFLGVIMVTIALLIVIILIAVDDVAKKVER